MIVVELNQSNICRVCQLVDNGKNNYMQYADFFVDYRIWVSENMLQGNLAPLYVLNIRATIGCAHANCLGYQYKLATRGFGKQPHFN